MRRAGTSSAIAAIRAMALGKGEPGYCAGGTALIDAAASACNGHSTHAKMQTQRPNGVVNMRQDMVIPDWNAASDSD